eukprot:CAMPEP_0114131200 /NCGR_PEP_ID=MMETSP0043_2-20121206/12423_1 /TAXON_ID=464988 /ORGANISM="Hemiselmis andersenii, Strain CCMP644" /LENGTH=248 /DNA_ID=CAMNT_0001224609 /DNA_START=172 /DNA_END=916 /DNA_ORIENTATION=+
MPLQNALLVLLAALACPPFLTVGGTSSSSSGHPAAAVIPAGILMADALPPPPLPACCIPQPNCPARPGQGRAGPHSSACGRGEAPEARGEDGRGGAGAIKQAIPTMTASRVDAEEELEASERDARAYRSLFTGTIRSIEMGEEGASRMTITAPPDGTNTTEAAFAWASFGGRGGVEGETVLVDPPSANAELANADALKGNIAVVVRGGTPFFEMARRAQDAGAAAVIIINSDDGLITPGAGEGDADGI